MLIVVSKSDCNRFSLRYSAKNARWSFRFSGVFCLRAEVCHGTGWESCWAGKGLAICDFIGAVFELLSRLLC